MLEKNDTAEALYDVLRRNGFVRCDIAACNCGSWHARHGWPERFAEFKDALQEAGGELTGVTALGALQALIAERDKLREAAEYAAHQLEKARIWGGMDWHYNPLHPMNYRPALERLRDAVRA